MRDCHSIRLQALDIRRPYEGCLAGWPSPDECVEAARKIATARFPYAPVVVIPPEERENDASRSGRQPKLIPPWCLTADLAGNPVKDQTCFESVLVVVWFVDEPTVDFKTILAQVDWAAHAQDVDP